MKWVKNCLTDRSLKVIVSAELLSKRSVTRVFPYAIHQWPGSKYKSTPDDICRWHYGWWNSKERESRAAWRNKLHRLAWANKMHCNAIRCFLHTQTKTWTSTAVLALSWTLKSESADVILGSAARWLVVYGTGKVELERLFKGLTATF